MQSANDRVTGGQMPTKRTGITGLMPTEPEPRSWEDADDDFLGCSYPMAPVPDEQREPRRISIEIAPFLDGFPGRAHHLCAFTHQINAELLRHDAAAVVDLYLHGEAIEVPGSPIREGEPFGSE